jgi:hypothetical protein
MCIRRSIDYLMKIPRGTFRVLKRRCSVHALIRELRDSSFSGYCKIAVGSDSIILVFKSGNIQLAEYGELEGNAALERVFQSDGLDTVDAVLHDLSPVQLDLAMEFNPGAVVKNRKSGKSIDPTGGHDGAENTGGTSPDLLKTGPKTDNPHHRNRPFQEAPHSLPAGKTAEKSRISPIPSFDDDASLLSGELDVLDAMDIEDMAAKFRANYRLMMKRLELDHLTDQTNGKDVP